MRKTLTNLPPALAATLRNAVADDTKGSPSSRNRSEKFINPHKLEKLSSIISNNINAASDLRAITPYIDKAELIWTTILLYPNGRQERVLSFDTENTRFKNSALHNVLLGVLEDYFVNDYKIERDLKKVISNVLFNTGSHIYFNLSRPGLDYLINGSELKDSVIGNEHYNKALSVLSTEFVEDGRKVKAINKGRYVASQRYKNELSNISGMESLLSNGVPRERELEFNIFKDSELDGLAEVMDITLTDNPAILFLQKINETKNEAAVEDVMGLESLESIINSSLATKRRTTKPKKPDATTSNLTTDQLTKAYDSIFPNRNVENRSLQFVKSNDSLSIAPYGRGIVWECPSEAVIPIHYNGSTEKKIDYILLLDEEGNFLRNTDDFNIYSTRAKNRANTKHGNKRGSTNSLIESLRVIQEGGDCDFDLSEFVDLAKDSIIKRFIASIISNRGDGMSVTIDEETNKIFLANMFKKQGVRCLYVPGEAITYIALKYNDLGLGESLVQSAKMHIARLAAYDIADALANLEGAQAHTILNITPEEEDPDPENSMALARDKYFANNPTLHSLLTNRSVSVHQIADVMRESALTIRMNPGDNKHVIAPETSLEAYEKQTFKPVDSSSYDAVKDNIANYFHVPRSWIDVSDEANDFKIEAITEHEMVYNLAVHWQNELCEGLTDFMRKHTRVNGMLLNRLVEAINDNKKLWIPDSKDNINASGEGDTIKVILTDFLNGLYCELPTPVSIESTNKLKDSIEAVDQLVEAWTEMSGSKLILEKVIKLLGIDAEEYTFEEIQEQIKAVFLVEGFRRYNLPMPFDEVVSDGEGGGIASLVNAISDHSSNVGQFLFEYVNSKVDVDKKLVKSNRKKLQKKLQELQELLNENEELEEEVDSELENTSEDGGVDPFSEDTGGGEETSGDGLEDESSEEEDTELVDSEEDTEEATEVEPAGDEGEVTEVDDDTLANAPEGDNPFA